MDKYTSAPPADVLASIRAIVDYDYETEAEDYEDQHPDDREGHVFEHLQRVEAWLDSKSNVSQTLYSIALEHGDDHLFATREQADEYAELSGNGPVSERQMPTFEDGEAILADWRDAALNHDEADLDRLEQEGYVGPEN
jgi:hypothetical protein